ncbi:hypothetical protein EVAR_74277_1 [Eumeta japonica]|uniref:Uncharacterized protein n=1 Tax=Eumeta variegata TaxID=151549 RepID=A0A4C1SCV8_EUMVA|nr:hypothetical protein EVAR_74277_1 [Eumeta japonica]
MKTTPIGGRNKKTAQCFIVSKRRISQPTKVRDESRDERKFNSDIRKLKLFPCKFRKPVKCANKSLGSLPSAMNLIRIALNVSILKSAANPNRIFRVAKQTDVRIQGMSALHSSLIENQVGFRSRLLLSKRETQEHH